MKNQAYKRLMALALISAMIAGSTACGNKQATQSTISETSAESKAQMTELVVTADQETTATINGLDDGLCSWETGGTDATTLDGDDYAMTPVVFINNGAYEADKSIAGETEAVTDTEISNLDLTVEKEAVNGIIINNSDYTIKDSSVNINVPEADGSQTCDFSGIGAAIAVYGDSNLTVSNTEINVDGVANLAVFADNGSSALPDNVTLHSDGGTLYENYINSPNQGTMVAPPWILGIMGNSRGTNLMGDDSTMSVVDSDVSAYGTYAIGNAQETFLGTTMDVGTYATIFTGGTGYYGNLKAGQSYDLLAADGTTHYTYEAKEDAQTVINSDTFGFMAHQGDNECTLDGVTVNSAFTDFIIKSGNNTTINVINGAEINAENGILLQLLDNDDSTTEFNPNDETVGMAFGTSHEEYTGFPTEAVDVSAEADNSLADTLVAGGQPEDMEAPAGEAPEGGAPEEGAPGGGAPGGEAESSVNQSVYNIKDSALTGAIYNGIGWNANALSQGKVKQMLLDVNLSGTATLAGPIASTSCIHATYDGQNYLRENKITAFDNDADAAAFAADYQAASFTLAEYFNIGQVANLVKSNGLNDIKVTVSDNAVWTITDTSLIAGLTISDDAQVIVEDGVTLTVDGTVYEAGTYTAADFQ